MTDYANNNMKAWTQPNITGDILYGIEQALGARGPESTLYNKIAAAVPVLICRAVASVFALIEMTFKLPCGIFVGVLHLSDNPTHILKTVPAALKWVSSTLFCVPVILIAGGQEQ